MKRLLIIEEALRDLKAHWFEYIKTIAEESQQKGWFVEVACHQNAASKIQQTFSSLPIFRYARYLDNKNNRLPGDRYYGFILHSIRSLKVLWPLLKQQPQYDAIFLPTVLMHHLLAWWCIMTFHSNRPRHLTLFFVTNPGVWKKQTNSAVLTKSSMLTGQLLKLFTGKVKQQIVTLAVETQVAKQEFEALTQLPFSLFPHPVSAYSTSITSTQSPLNFACYGFARYEKGSDLLQLAIEKLLKEHPEVTAKFSIQWLDSFTLPNGSTCEIRNLLKSHPNVRIVDRAMMPEEYQRLLQQTSCMILPYRNSSYYARVSRVAIEAAYQGIPMIYTRGGWLEEAVSNYGSGIGIQDESLEDLVEAIITMATTYDSYRQKAIKNSAVAKQYFSADTFCKQLLDE